MNFVTMTKTDKSISARADMVDYYESIGWSVLGSEKAVQATNVDAPRLSSTPAPTIAEMRSWALEKGIQGVKAQGKLPKHAIQAYREAHKGS